MIAIHELICKMPKIENKNENDLLMTRLFKTMIIEIANIKSFEIWIDYETITNHHQQDKIIKYWIETVLT